MTRRHSRQHKPTKERKICTEKWLGDWQRAAQAAYGVAIDHFDDAGAKDVAEAVILPLMRQASQEPVKIKLGRIRELAREEIARRKS